MSRKPFKAVVLLVLALSALTSASAASASTWTSNGTAAGTGFTATAPASKLTLTSISFGTNCSNTRATGSLYGPTGTVLVDPVADLSLAFTSCRFGGFSETWSCPSRSVSWWPVSYNSTTRTVSGTWNAAASNICTITFSGFPGCQLQLNPTNGFGAAVIGVDYNDATSVMSLNASGQALTGVWTNCGTLFGSANGSSPATITDSSGATLSYRITSAFVPNVTI